MTVNPDCATLDTTILDALHILHDGKFLHVPVVDGGRIRELHYLVTILLFLQYPCMINLLENLHAEGQVVACLDVLQLTHAAISMVTPNFFLKRSFKSIILDL